MSTGAKILIASGVFVFLLLLACLIITNLKSRFLIVNFKIGMLVSLRGGSTIIDINYDTRIVWFKTKGKDSTYFYEPFSKLGIE